MSDHTRMLLRQMLLIRRFEEKAAELRAQLDLDSMDVLNFVVGLHEAFGVDIPEADYPKYATVAGCVEELAARVRPAD